MRYLPAASVCPDPKGLLVAASKTVTVTPPSGPFQCAAWLTPFTVPLTKASGTRSMYSDMVGLQACTSVLPGSSVNTRAAARVGSKSAKPGNHPGAVAPTLIGPTGRPPMWYSYSPAPSVTDFSAFPVLA